VYDPEITIATSVWIFCHGCPVESPTWCRPITPLLWYHLSDHARGTVTSLTAGEITWTMAQDNKARGRFVLQMGTAFPLPFHCLNTQKTCGSRCPTPAMGATHRTTGQDSIYLTATPHKTPTTHVPGMVRSEGPKDALNRAHDASTRYIVCTLASWLHGN
jgi:hypothetical protein